jgi:hypothetical protein
MSTKLPSARFMQTFVTLEINGETIPVKSVSFNAATASEGDAKMHAHMPWIEKVTFTIRRYKPTSPKKPTALALKKNDMYRKRR